MALSKITSSSILDGSIASADLGANSVTTAKIGADVITAPLKSIIGLLKHPLTDIGLENFLKDYRKGN